MLMTKQKMLSAFMALTMLSGAGMASLATSAMAASRYYPDYNSRYYNDSRIGNFFYNHPYLKKAAIGGGAGAAVGALVARDGNRVNGAIKGALIGAGAGLGYEYLRQQGILRW